MKLNFDGTIIDYSVATYLRAFRPSLVQAWYHAWGTIPVFSWIRAAEAFKSADFRTAAFFYRKGFRGQKDHAALLSARLDYAYCLHRLDRTLEAIEELRPLVGELHAPRESFVLLGTLLEAVGDKAEAAQVYRSASFRFADDLGLKLDAAIAQLDGPLTAGMVGFFRQQLGALRARIELDNSLSVKCDFVGALLEIRHGDGDYGDSLLTKVLATGSAPLQATVLRAERWLEQSRITNAREILQRALRADPRNPRILSLIAKSYLLEPGDGHSDFALQLALEACRESEYKNPLALQILALAYEDSGEENGAELTTMRLLEITTEKEVDFAQLSVVERQLERLRTSKLSSAG